MQTNTAPILELRDVTVSRGEQIVFDRLTLTLTQGEHTAILGPNGSGKSTLLKLLSNDLHPWPDDQAVFRLFGQDRWNVWDLRAHLGIVSHDLQRDYDGSATVSEVLLSGFYASSGVYPHQSFSAVQRTRAHQVAQAVGVVHLLNRLYVTLSTGEQRRCLLGRALVHRPSVLILDEPTSGLDPRAASIYLEHVRDLMAKGTTVVIVTHHVHEIPPETHRVILMKEGRIWADGRRADMLTSQRLSELYETPLEMIQAGGYVYAVPKGQTSN
ncbi:MAG: ATP-binding cassette domain-containing protein [Nitrospiraceae bacterium]